MEYKQISDLAELADFLSTILPYLHFSSKPTSVGFFEYTLNMVGDHFDLCFSPSSKNIIQILMDDYNLISFTTSAQNIVKDIQVIDIERGSGNKIMLLNLGDNAILQKQVHNFTVEYSLSDGKIINARPNIMVNSPATFKLVNNKITLKIDRINIIRALYGIYKDFRVEDDFWKVGALEIPATVDIATEINSLTYFPRGIGSFIQEVLNNIPITP